MALIFTDIPIALLGLCISEASLSELKIFQLSLILPNIIVQYIFETNALIIHFCFQINFFMYYHCKTKSDLIEIMENIQCEIDPQP